MLEWEKTIWFFETFKIIIRAIVQINTGKKKRGGVSLLNRLNRCKKTNAQKRNSSFMSLKIQAVDQVYEEPEFI